LLNILLGQRRKMKNGLILAVITIFLTGCGGGTIGGLLPAPKILKGDMDGTVYRSPDKEFSVKAPVSKDRGELLYTSVREHSEINPDQSSNFVGFKTPYDDHFYSIEVVDLKNSISRENADLIISDNSARVKHTTEEKWKSKLTEISEHSISCQETTYTYQVFHQEIDTKGIVVDKYILLSQGYIGSKFIIATSELNYRRPHANPPLDSIKNASLKKHRDFICSVIIKII